VDSRTGANHGLGYCRGEALAKTINPLANNNISSSRIVIIRRIRIENAILTTAGSVKEAACKRSDV
jgi:hypothetical protein